MTHYSRNNAIDFAALKASVSIAAVLLHYGVELYGGGAERTARCPFHDDRHPSLQVNIEKGLFNCFGCGAKGSVLDFVAKQEGCGLSEAAARIASIARNEKAPATEAAEAGSGRRWREEPPTEHRQDCTTNRPLSSRLSLDPSHPYLASRGIAEETARAFGMGFCDGGLLRGRVAIPIHDEGGKLVAYAGRWAGSDDDLPEGEGKYKFPRGFRKSLVLYNLHRVDLGAEVVLVEGFFGAIAVHLAGLPNVVALMGSTISREQRRLIVARFRRVVIFLDGDTAGRAATDVVRRNFEQGVEVRVAWCRLGRQPDTLSADELRQVLS